MVKAQPRLTAIERADQLQNRLSLSGNPLDWDTADVIRDLLARVEELQQSRTAMARGILRHLTHHFQEAAPKGGA